MRALRCRPVPDALSKFLLFLGNSLLSTHRVIQNSHSIWCVEILATLYAPDILRVGVAFEGCTRSWSVAREP